MFHTTRRVYSIPFIPIVLLLLFSSCMNWIGEPIERAKNQASTSQMSRSRAKNEVAVALIASTENCPVFYNSGLNMFMNWGMMLGSGPDSSGSYFSGNADDQFVDRGAVHSCLMSLTTLQQACQQSGSTVNTTTTGSSQFSDPVTVAHFSSFGVCAAALKSSLTAPMIFF